MITGQLGICATVSVLQMQDKDITKLLGEVEVDETFMGGKEKNKHVSKRGKGRGTTGKIPVIGAIARKGNVVCRMIENTDTGTLDGCVRQVVGDSDCHG